MSITRKDWNKVKSLNLYEFKEVNQISIDNGYSRNFDKMGLVTFFETLRDECKGVWRGMNTILAVTPWKVLDYKFKKYHPYYTDCEEHQRCQIHLRVSIHNEDVYFHREQLDLPFETFDNLTDLRDRK